MRNYENFDRYLNILQGDIYLQPEDIGHSQLSKKVIDNWMSKMTTCTSVLDVGCGTGFCQPLFEFWNVSYEGVCLGDDFLQAQQNNRNVKKMDYTFLSYPDDYVDLVFSRHSLEHSPFPLISLMEWARVSKNWLGLVLPHPDWYGYKGLNHYSVMTLEQIKVVLDRAGWYVIWETVDSLPFESDKPETSRPHEIWLMCEKKRG